jgi:hypothetical protein
MSRPSAYDLPEMYVETLAGPRTLAEDLDADDYLRHLDLDRLEAYAPVNEPRRST